jgi:4-hydroxythreonine-4-phosphate dehydrogenase
MALPRIGLTVGDPAGIGPEVCARAARDSHVVDVCAPVMYGPVSEDERAAYRTGTVSAEGGRVAFDAIRAATADALAGRLDAITTAPINKAGWALAGLPWRGHTDLLAHLTGASPVAMMFHAEPLRVVLATVHIPLSEVPRQLTRERLEHTIRLAHTELPWFGFSHPRLAVAGLNPHAGEHGLMGDEEERVVQPAVQASRDRGIDVTGPLPGDSVFVRALKGEFDAVVACYHDQGLIPVKLAAFGSAVNVTLGLPIVRTSVDHGTAYDIAGQGIADPTSMIQAVLLAARLASARALVSHE